MRLSRTSSALAATVALGGAIALAAPAQAAPPAQPSAVLSVKAANTCPTWTVIKNGVNFRSGPGTKHNSKGHVYYGDFGKKVDRSGSWVKVKLGKKSRTGISKNSTGWVHKKYLSQCVYMNLN